MSAASISESLLSNVPNVSIAKSVIYNVYYLVFLLLNDYYLMHIT